MISARELCSSRTGQTEPVSLDPSLSPAGWGGGHLFLTLTLQSSPLLIYHHTVIRLTVLSEALLRLTLRPFCPFRGTHVTQYRTFSCTGEPRASVSVLVRDKARHCCHSCSLAVLLGSGEQVLCHPVSTEELKPRSSSPSDRVSRERAGRWWNVRGRPGAAGSPVCSLLQNRVLSVDGRCRI